MVQTMSYQLCFLLQALGIHSLSSFFWSGGFNTPQVDFLSWVSL